MSTRAMIAVQMNGNGSYFLYYRHCDGYPEGLGQELADAIKKGVGPGGIEGLMKRVGAKAENRSVQEPEEAFINVQGDLDWIYVIRNPQDPELISLEILKTSNLADGKPYTFPVFWSYRKYMSRAVDMKTAGYAGTVILGALRAAERAKKEAKA